MGRLSRILFLGVLALAGYYALFGGRYSVFETRQADRERAVLQARLDSLQAVNARLEARVDSLENDPVTLERVAREEYGMVRPGERLFRDTTSNDAEPRLP
jgi:cell division protein FtsB